MLFVFVSLFDGLLFLALQLDCPDCHVFSFPVLSDGLLHVRFDIKLL